MFRLLVLACALGLSAGVMGPGKMMRKFAHTKIMEGCLGEELVAEWIGNYMGALAKCSEQEISFDTSRIPSIESFMQSLRRDGMNRQRMQQAMVIPVMPFSSGNSLQGMSIQQLLSRGKRNAHIMEMLNAKRDMLISKISNTTCIMREFNLVNEDNTVNVDQWRTYYEEMEIDQDVKDDMLEAVDICHQFATCMPVNMAKNPIIQEMGQLIIMAKCDYMHKTLACVKSGFRKQMGDSVVEAEGNLVEQGLSFGVEGDEDPMDAMFELLMVNDDPNFNLM